jgi:MFS family permease
MSNPPNKIFAANLVDRPTPVKFRDVRALFSRPDFARLVGVRIFGQTGDGMVQAALTSFVLFSPERQPTALKIALAFAILLLPYSIFGPFVGTFIDRWPRQRILFWASLIRALSVALVALVVVSKNDGALLGVVVLVSLGIGRFLLATLSASLPHVAREQELTTANAFAPTAGTMSSAFGGILGVSIQQLTGDAGVLAALAVSAFLQIIAALIASGMNRDLLGPDSIVRGVASRMKTVFVELVAGWKHLTAAPAAARALLLVVWHRHVFGLSTVWLLLLLRNSLNTNAAADRALVEFATTVGAAAAGALLGALMAPLMVGKFGTRAWSSIVLLTSAPFAAAGFAVTIAMPESPLAIYGVLASGAFLGWIGQTVKVCGDTVVQASIDDDHRGRVFAIYDMAVNSGLVSGIVLAAVALSNDGINLWPVIYIFLMLSVAPLLLRTPPIK